RADALLPERVADDLVHRPQLRQREPRIDAPNRRSHVGGDRVRIAPRAQHERQRARAVVLRAEVELRAAVLMHVVQASLIDDADDGQRGVLSGWNLRAERTAGRKTLLRENRIDEHFTNTIPAGTLERASGQYAHPHDFGAGRAN